MRPETADFVGVMATTSRNGVFAERAIAVSVSCPHSSFAKSRKAARASVDAGSTLDTECRFGIAVSLRRAILAPYGALRQRLWPSVDEVRRFSSAPAVPLLSCRPGLSRPLSILQASGGLHQAARPHPRWSRG